MRGLLFGEDFAGFKIVAVNFADLEFLRFFLRGGERGVGGVEFGLRVGCLFVVSGNVFCLRGFACLGGGCLFWRT